MQSRHLFFKLQGRFKKPNKSVRDPSSRFKTTAAEKKDVHCNSRFFPVYKDLSPPTPGPHSPASANAFLFPGQ